MYQKTEEEVKKNWKDDTNIPVVSICNITYNHESYIAEALDSFLMQETDFPFEVLINDDCSTDNTANIIREYEKKYPNIIKPIYQEVNQYSKRVRPNTAFNYPRSKGKYIALCEGDDYWTDPLKLQKQVDFLEEHHDYALCYTSATLMDDKGFIIQKNKNFGDSNEDELMASVGHAITGSVLYRRFDFNEYASHDILNGDTLLWHYLGFYGKCKHLDDIKNTVYRIHGDGTWSGRSDRSKLVEHLKTYKVIRSRLIKHHGLQSEILNKHDTIYINIFFNYFSNNIIKIDNFIFGIKKLNELKFVNKKKIFKKLSKHILKLIYKKLRLNKAKGFIQGFVRKHYDNYLEHKYELFNKYKKTSGLNSKKRNRHVVISLTSYHKRFNSLYLTLESLLNQSYKPDQIVLWLSQEDIDKVPLPEKVKKLKSRGLDIQIVDENIRSYKKLIYTLQKYPDSHIVTCDDDILYNSSFLQGLIETSLIYQKCIVAYTCRMMKLIDSTKFEPYRYSSFVSHDGPSSALLPIGANGILYPPNSLSKEVLNKDNFLKLAPHADDLWFKAMALLNNTKAVLVKNKSKRINSISSLQNEALNHINLLDNKNDEQLKNIFDFYSLYETINKI